MQSKNTRALGASQARFCRPNPHADATRRSRLKFVWLEELKRLVAEEAGRSACKIQKVSHRLVCDLAETFARYPSFTQHGQVWAGQAALALQLGVDVRQVRRAIAVLLELKVLSIKRPSRGQRRDTNTMVALLDERPLFAVVEDDHRVSPSAEYRTPTSPNHRATASSNSKEEELKKDSSPVGPSNTSRRKTPVAKEEESNFDELNSGGGCSQDDLRPSATKPNSRKTGDDGASLLRSSRGFIRIPEAQREKPAYEPMARQAWGALSNAQKAEAIDAAPHARGRLAWPLAQRCSRDGNFRARRSSPPLDRACGYAKVRRNMPHGRKITAHMEPPSDNAASRWRTIADRLDVRKRMAAEFQARPTRWRGSMNAPFTTPIRTAPHNIEAEQALLGAMLVNNEAFYRVSDFLEPKHFLEGIHQRIYEIAGGLIRAGKLATPVTLKTFLPVDLDIAGLTVNQYLARLAAEATTIINAEDYGRTVYDLSIRRDLITIGEEMVNLAYEAPVDATPIKPNRSRRAPALRACRERALRQGVPAIWSSIGRRHGNGRACISARW